MSYILEALKKSQKERELGQVPTLADAPYLAGDKPAREAYWGIVAVTLAVLATIIALYAAFGEQLLSAGRPPPSMPETTQETPPEARPAVPVSAPAAATPEVAAPVSNASRPEKPSKTAQTLVTPAATVLTPDSEQGSEQRAKPAQAPVKTTKPVAPPTQTTATEPAVVVPPKQGRQSPPPPPNVPPELVREVRRFKEHLRQRKPMDERQTTDPALTTTLPVQPPASVAAESELTTDEEPARKVQAPPMPEPTRTVPSGQSDLPEALQKTFPKLRLTVHVYAATPEQRFVIINSRKMHEGDRSRDGLLLEEITPDGAMLEYLGQRFFRHR